MPPQYINGQWVDSDPPSAGVMTQEQAAAQNGPPIKTLPQGTPADLGSLILQQNPGLMQFVQGMGLAGMGPQATTTDKPPPAAKVTAPASVKQQNTTPGMSSTDDALTMGLGMFFQQYLAPMLAQTSQTNNNLISQWGSAMNNALQQPMPQGVRQTMAAFVPQQEQMLGMMNQAGLQQAAGTIPFQQLMQGLTSQTTATQALQDAFMKAATYQELGAGSPTSLAGLLTGALGGSGTLGGGLAQLLSGGGGGALLPSNPAVNAALTGATAANQTASQGYTNPNG